MLILWNTVGNTNRSSQVHKRWLIQAEDCTEIHKERPHGKTTSVTFDSVLVVWAQSSVYEPMRERLYESVNILGAGGHCFTKGLLLVLFTAYLAKLHQARIS